MSDSKQDPGIIVVSDLTSVTPEIEAQLRAKWERERLAAQSVAPPTLDGDEWVRTNMGHTVLFVPDLGSKVGDVFSAERFNPGESKDLARFYEVTELRKSRHLAKLTEKGKLARGYRQVEGVRKDALSARAQRDQEGTFADPVRRGYDDKLAALEAKEERQNRVRRG